MDPVNDLSKPVRRTHIHTRTYEGHAFEREDGLFDVEVEMRDTKPFSFDNTDRGYVAALEPLHHMKMRVTIDETMEIKDVEAQTFASPYTMCRDITGNYRNLIGVRIVGGFTKAVQRITGRAEGCTHHNDILKVVGTTAFQGLWTIIARRRREREGEEGPEAKAAREKMTAGALLNTCHAYAPSSPIVARQWPAAYVPATDAADEAGEPGSA